jgi:hypothetical protein
MSPIFKTLKSLEKGSFNMTKNRLISPEKTPCSLFIYGAGGGIRTRNPTGTTETSITVEINCSLLCSYFPPFSDPVALDILLKLFFRLTLLK